MNKRIIGVQPQADVTASDWLPHSEITDVELTSEDPEHPIDAALMGPPGGGWRASEPGEQTIRLNFSPPRPLHRVRIAVEEHERERTQEFVLRAAPSPDGPWRELVRQRYNFSPNGTTRENEEYRVALPAVATLELVITPDVSGGDAFASLAELRVA